jgi:hypothetical protein
MKLNLSRSECFGGKSLKGSLTLILVITLVIVLVVASTFYLLNFYANQQGQGKSNFHVGVSFGGNTTAEAKLLIDKVKTYTNLFVVQSGPVSVNETALNEIVDYSVSSGLDVVVYFGFFNPSYPWQVPWLDFAMHRWENHFLGVYLNDEPGGNLIDANWTGYFNQIKIRNASEYYLHVPTIDLAINGSLPPDYDLAASHFLLEVQTDLGLQNLKVHSVKAFTSDYALYWFDYLGGYDNIFVEFGSNQSITQPIALGRGAARLQNKTWGAIITWKYTQPPYLDSGSEIYNQMMSAYMSGANYVVIFDYPTIPGNPYGILTDEHFMALQKFWSNIQALKAEQAEAVLVLPKNYGWGMRKQDDRIWGVWGPDDKSPQIWNITQKLLTQYGLELDIVFDDSQFPVAGRYSQIYYWNQTA